MIRHQSAGAPRQDDLAEGVTDALRRIIRAIDLRSRELAMRYGLTGPQLAVLRELSGRDGLSAAQLARAVHASQATVTGILDRLARRGLLRRQRSDRDKRCVQVRLTDDGRQVLSDAPPLLHETFTREFGKLEDWEQTQMLSTIQRVASMMEEPRATPTSHPAAGERLALERTDSFLGEVSSGKSETAEDPGADESGEDAGECRMH